MMGIEYAFLHLAPLAKPNKACIIGEESRIAGK